MASTQEDPSNALLRAIPRQRGAADQEQILADERLIEAIRTGDCISDDPIAQMLVEWRAQVFAGT